MNRDTVILYHNMKGKCDTRLLNPLRRGRYTKIMRGTLLWPVLIFIGAASLCPLVDDRLRRRRPIRKLALLDAADSWVPR